MSRLITGKAVREKFLSIGRQGGPARIPSDMWLRRRIEREELPPPKTMIAGIRYFDEGEVDAAIAALIANPRRVFSPPPGRNCKPEESTP